MRTFLLAFATLLMLSPASATAQLCSNTEYRQLMTIQDVSGELGGDLYVVNDFCQLDPVGSCFLSFWIYQESNGIDGLQRGDDRCIPGECVHDAGWCAPDTLIF